MVVPSPAWSTGVPALGSGSFKFGSARLGSVGFVSEPFELGSGDAGEELGSKGVSFVESDIENKGRQMEGSGLPTGDTLMRHAKPLSEFDHSHRDAEKVQYPHEKRNKACS